MRILKTLAWFISLLTIMSCNKETIIVEENNCFDNIQNSSVNHGLIGKWIFIGYIDNQEHCKPITINEIFISFSDSSNFISFSSCNSMNGAYEINNAGVFTIIESTVTEVGCSTTSMEWEKKFFYGLSTVKKLFIDGNILTIETESNDVFIFVAD